MKKAADELAWMKKTVEALAWTESVVVVKEKKCSASLCCVCEIESFVFLPEES